MATDPYRQEPPGHPVEHLRKIIEHAIGGMTARLSSLPPSMLERWAEKLANLDTEHETRDPVEIIRLLRNLAIVPVPGPDLLVAGPFQCMNSFDPLVKVIEPVEPFYVAALRVEMMALAPHHMHPDFALFRGDHCVLERCPVTEFDRMTPMDIGCLASSQLPTPVSARTEVKIWPTGNHIEPVVRLIFRGEYPRLNINHYPFQGPGVPIMKRPIR